MKHSPGAALLAICGPGLRDRGAHAVVSSARVLMIDTMQFSGRDEIAAGLARHLPRLWRYGVVLSGNRETAEDLVQATCVRALERADQFAPGSRLDRWLFSILRSIWLNEIRARRIRQGRGFVDPETALIVDLRERGRNEYSGRPGVEGSPGPAGSATRGCLSSSTWKG